MPDKTFDREFYEAALRGFEQSKVEINRKIDELRNLLGRNAAGGETSSNRTTGTRKRTLTSAARKRIAEAQRKRWARFRSAETAPPQKRGGKAAG